MLFLCLSVCSSHSVKHIYGLVFLKFSTNVIHYTKAEKCIGIDYLIPSYIKMLALEFYKDDVATSLLFSVAVELWGSLNFGY